MPALVKCGEGDMKRFPLLEQLRAERERTEAEIAAPFLEHIGKLANVNARLRSDNQDYSSFLSRGVEDRLLDAMRAIAADDFAPMVMKALGAALNEPVT